MAERQLGLFWGKKGFFAGHNQVQQRKGQYNTPVLNYAFGKFGESKSRRYGDFGNA